MGLLNANSLGQGAAETPAEKKEKAAGMLESLMVKQILQASGAFKGQGGQIHNELFVDAIADAVAKGGGLGIGKLLGEQAAAGSAPLAFSGPGPGVAAQVAHSLGGLPDLIAGQERVTSHFGQRSDPFTGQAKAHRGIDLAAPEGSPIFAAQSGVVKSVGERGGYGLAVEVEHAGGVTTLYGHASETLVQVGDQIEKGQAIARVGHSGRATGDHLHFEVRQRGGAVDPRTALKAYAKSVDTQDKGF
jgi:murein DD-endopeptidase MepM/ murein hydrolase activator NlpD